MTDHDLRRTTCITNEMIEAAMQAWADLSDAPVAMDAEENHQDMATILAAALDAAPAADGWHWCEAVEDVMARLGDGRCFDSDDCPGPHRALVVGPVISEQPLGASDEV